MWKIIENNAQMYFIILCKAGTVFCNTSECNKLYLPWILEYTKNNKIINCSRTLVSLVSQCVCSFFADMTASNLFHIIWAASSLCQIVHSSWTLSLCNWDVSQSDCRLRCSWQNYFALYALLQDSTLFFLRSYNSFFKVKCKTRTLTFPQR